MAKKKSTESETTNQKTASVKAEPKKARDKFVYLVKKMGQSPQKVPRERYEKNPEIYQFYIELKPVDT